VVQPFDEEEHRGEERDHDADGEKIHASTVRPGPWSPCGVRGPRHQDRVKAVRSRVTGDSGPGGAAPVILWA
jgi:hypothetical protein